MTKERQKPGRKPAIRQSLALALPPRGRDAEWSSVAGQDLAGQRPVMITGHVRIRILVSLVAEQRNLDSIAGALLDLLSAHRVIDLDAVADLALRWDRTVTPGRVRIEMAQTTPPAERVGADTRALVSRIQAERWAAARAARRAA
jgi:hypothetical protein